MNPVNILFQKWREFTIFRPHLFIGGFISNSKYNKKGAQVVEMKDSNAEKIRQMEARIKELEQAVGQKK